MHQLTDRNQNTHNTSSQHCNQNNPELQSTPQLPRISPSRTDIRPRVDMRIIHGMADSLYAKAHINVESIMTGLVRDEWSRHIMFFLHEELLPSNPYLGMYTLHSQTNGLFSFLEPIRSMYTTLHIDSPYCVWSWDISAHESTSSYRWNIWFPQLFIHSSFKIS